ncbi:MAG: sulfatase-like hydrolase/transferase [Victivallaceae bacterium]|nr:sulfatase-like hydrolase/transferase [Victivallaceae bacterium]
MQPNIIFILVDQLRHDMLGCYGHPVAITPNIDQLAAHGVLFENFYATNPICLPSRASMITGKYVHDHHCHHNIDLMSSDEICFPALLRDNGYNTAVIGKLHLWEQWNGHCAVDHGFQFQSLTEGKHSQHSRVEESGMYYDYLNEHDLPLPFSYDSKEQINKMFWSRISEYSPDDHIDGVITNRAIRFIDQHDNKLRQRPFMMQIGLCSPHEFYDPPQGYYDLYEGIDIPEPTYVPDSVAQKSNMFRDAVDKKLTDFYLPKTAWGQETIEKVKAMRRHYLATISFIDDQVGKIVDALKRNAIYDNSVIVFAADHGEYQGDHGMIIKNNFLYEPNVHVPLIISAPATARENIRVDAFAQNVDLFATFLDIAGVAKPEKSYSRSLMPLVKGSAIEGREAVFAEMYDRRMIRKGKYKLLYYGNEKYLELYDVDIDPLEQHNLIYAGNPDRDGYNEIVKELLMELVDFFINTEAAPDSV